MHRNPDIAIVGGGLVGLSSALALQHPDRHICVIESSALQQQKSNGLDARSIALSYASFEQSPLVTNLVVSDIVNVQTQPVTGTVHIEFLVSLFLD